MRLQTAPSVVWLALEKAALPPLPSNALGSEVDSTRCVSQQMPETQQPPGLQ